MTMKKKKFLEDGNIEIVSKDEGLKVLLAFLFLVFSNFQWTGWLCG